MGIINKYTSIHIVLNCLIQKSDFFKMFRPLIQRTNSLPVFHYKSNDFSQAVGLSRAAEFFALCQGPKVPIFCFD